MTKSKICIIATIVLSISVFSYFAESTLSGKGGFVLLLSRLNLDAKALEQVKLPMKNPELALQNLLKYYQTRISVKHPVDPNGKREAWGYCQPDKGTFELSAGGRNLMPDGGSYI